MTVGIGGMMFGTGAAGSGGGGGSGLSIGGDIGSGTAGRVLIEGVGPVLADDGDLTFAVDTLTVTKIVASSSFTNSSLTATRIPFSGAAGLQSDDAALTYTVGTGLVSSTLYRSGAGSAGAPAVSFTGDTDTGGYSVGANNYGIATGGVLRLDLDGSGMLYAQTVLDAATPRGVKLTYAANTAVTASTEAIDFYVSSARTQQWATGALTTQRGVLVDQPTWAFVGASTITTGIGMEVFVPSVGANATVTDLRGFRVGANCTAGPSAAATTYAGLSIATSTVTYTNTTAQTGVGSVSGLRVNPVTIAQNTGSGTLTIASAASLYVPSPAAAGTGAALTEALSILVGTGQNRLNHSDSSAATTLLPLVLSHTTSTTATAGIGVGLDLQAHNGAGTLKSAATVSGMLRTVTNGAENGVLLFQQVTAGAPANGGHVTSGSVFANTLLGIGTLSAVGLTTNTMTIQQLNNMITYTNSLTAVGGHQFSGTANTSGRRSFFVTSPSANTAITTATERVGHAFGSTTTTGIADLTSIVQTWANGTVALQRENVWVAPTYLQTSGTQVMTKAVHHDFGSIPQITGTTNSITGARIARFGGSVAQGVTAAATDYVGIELVPHTITYTGSTQVTSTVAASQLRLDVLTLTDASAVTIDQAATLDIVGAVAQAGSVTITKKLALLVRAGDSKFGGNIGFYNTDPVAKPTVTGSRATSAAIASLLTALASQGLITDSSTA
jgi:hypothetical protein